MKLSTELYAIAKALRLAGLGIAGSSLLAGNVYFAGGGVFVTVVGEAIEGAADVIARSGNEK